MKLRTRLSLFTMTLMALVVAGTSASTVYLLRRLLMEESMATQRALFDNFRRVCEETRVTNDDIFLDNYIKSLVKTVPGLQYAAFVDTDRGLIIGRNDAFIDAFPDPTIAESPMDLKLRTRANQAIMDMGGDVSIRGRRLGVARLGILQSAVEAGIREKTNQVQRIVLMVTCFALAVGLVVAFWMAAQITHPIGLLAQGAKELGEGNLDTQIDIQRSDEIGFLASEFNIMAVKLKELDQLKDDFVSSVSHELRSPLSAIAGYVELLTSKPIEQVAPEKRAKAFAIIQESTSRLTQFINDILDLAKIKSGRVEVRKGPFSVKKAADDILALFHPLLEGKKLQGINYVEANVSLIPADEDKVKQVLTNLVSNAFKFTPEGGAISISAQEDAEKVTVSVSDTGVGIPKDFLGQIFERFKQVPGTKEKIGGHKGTGLGLAIAKGIVEGHGGRIWAESEPGRGSTFRFTLPKGDTQTGAGRLF